MRNDLLFIDGELVDLDDNTNITLKYSSNIFTDLNKIVSNSSYTIKLPDTVRNQRVIEHADLPACNTDFQRRVHAARYFRNGIEIISKAQAVLMSVSEAFDIALIWGNKTSFASIINDGKKLTDLKSGAVEGEDYVVWKNWGAFSERFPNINYGFNNGEANVWNHPVVKARWILDKIKEESGVTFQFPPDKLSFINKMIIPLLTRNDSQLLYDRFPVKLIGNGVAYSSNVYNYAGINLNFNGDNTQTKFGEIIKYKQSWGATVDGYKIYYNSTNTKLEGTIKASFTSNSTDIKYVNIRIAIDGNNILEIPVGGFIRNGDLWSVTFYVNAVFDINEGQILSLLLFNGKAPFSNKDISVEINLGMILSKRGEILFGEKYPFVPNLPDMKQIDFIKAISQMLGVFAIPVGDDTIQFVSVDDIIANKSKAINWTRKVIASSYKNKPKSMNYILDGFARNNRFKWKEDNTVTGNYDGNILVNDSTIEYERDAVTLPFAASDTIGDVAYIPIYSYKEDGSLNYSAKNVKPRILYQDGVKGVFTGLSWEKLLTDNYSNYIKVVNNPRIITEKIEISDIDLKLLDVTVPVYLGQYGRYYAIISVKAENSGICECKLLQLEV